MNVEIINKIKTNAYIFNNINVGVVEIFSNIDTKAEIFGRIYTNAEIYGRIDTNYEIMRWMNRSDKYL